MYVSSLRSITCSPCLQSLVKTEANVWENSSRSVKTRSWGFSDAREFLQTLLRFSPGYEGTVNMFYLFYKFIVYTTICELSMYTFISFMKQEILITLRQPTILLRSFSWLIVLWKLTCRPIKTHFLIGLPCRLIKTHFLIGLQGSLLPSG